MLGKSFGYTLLVHVSTIYHLRIPYLIESKATTERGTAPLKAPQLLCRSLPSIIMYNTLTILLKVTSRQELLAVKQKTLSTFTLFYLRSASPERRIPPAPSTVSIPRFNTRNYLRARTAFSQLSHDNLDLSPNPHGNSFLV